tara:strand:+ start:3627 stop:3884 length:258 start_codon:yes stop_codon:yes gene_type:complete
LASGDVAAGSGLGGCAESSGEEGSDGGDGELHIEVGGLVLYTWSYKMEWSDWSDCEVADVLCDDGQVLRAGAVALYLFNEGNDLL